MTQQVITVVGGTGFVGRYVVRLLASAGYTVRVIARDPSRALALKTCGNVGQVVLESGDLARPDSLAGKLDNSYAVINLVGVLFERGRENFTLHSHGAEKLAQIAKAAGALRYVHLSALGVDKASGSQYARSKMLGEKAVLTAFPEATILRPSVIFGPEDDFYNQFARMAMLFPALPSIGGGRTRFQPVYVGDVARAVVASLTKPDAAGRTYELGGPGVYTFKEILQYILKVTGRDRWLLPLPFGIASLLGVISELASRLPIIRKPMLTRDQVKLLHYDNVVSPGARTFANLGINATAVEMVVPDYLERFARHPVIAKVAQ